MKLSLRYGLILIFLVVTASFAALIIQAYFNNAKRLSASQSMSNTNKRLLNAHRLFKYILDAETGQRGYILTGNTIFLEPYYDALDSIPSSFNDLKIITIDNPVQQANVSKLWPLIEQRLQFGSQNIDTRKRSAEEAQEEFMSLIGKGLTDEIREVINEIIQIEQNSLTQLTLENEKETSNFNTTYLTSIGIALSIVLILLYLVFSNLNSRNNEQELLESLKETSDYKFALDESCIVAITDQKGVIKFANDKFCEISKYSRKELLGQDHRIINSGFHSKEFVKDLWRTIASGKVWLGELRNTAKDGSIYWVDTTIVPFLNEQGKPYQYVAIRSDITNRKKRELEIVNLNKELESFSYSISHDLRAPLRSINGYATALVEDYSTKLDEEGKRLLAIVIKNATRMGKLIDDLLEFSRLGRQKLAKSSVNMDEFVEQIADELVEQRKGQRIDLNITPLGHIMADANLLRQVWVNLLSNALKYSEQKETSIIKIGRMNDNGSISTFFVQDNGAGFDMNYYDKLFGVFQRLHKANDFEGTGVGLALVKRIIDNHGGRIWAEAEVGVGATFYFTLS